MKKIILPIVAIIVVVFLALAFIGGSSSTTTNNDPKKVGEVIKTTIDINNTETPKQTIFNLRDKIDFESRILTVNSIQRNYIENSDYAFKPAEGDEFILINVTIENNSKQPISFNTLDFEIENSSGVRTNRTFAGEISDELNSGNLALGGKVTGNIPFKVKADEQKLKLIFKPSFLTNKEVIINLD